MILQNNLIMVAMREENKKLSEELDKHKNGKVQRHHAVPCPTFLTEHSDASMEECTEIPLPKCKAVEHNAEGTL